MNRNVISKIGDIALFAALLTSVTLLFMFQRRDKELREQLRDGEAKAYPLVGDYLPDVPVAVLGVQSQTSTMFSATKVPAVVYFFAPDCKYCAGERDKLPTFAAEAQTHGYSFAAVSTESANETRRMFPNALSFPILAEAGGDINRAYRVHGTPIYVSINSSRRISAVHLGVLPIDKFSPELLR